MVVDVDSPDSGIREDADGNFQSFGEGGADLMVDRWV